MEKDLEELALAVCQKAGAVGPETAAVLLAALFLCSIDVEAAEEPPRPLTQIAVEEGRKESETDAGV